MKCFFFCVLHIFQKFVMHLSLTLLFCWLSVLKPNFISKVSFQLRFLNFKVKFYLHIEIFRQTGLIKNWLKTTSNVACLLVASVFWSSKLNSILHIDKSLVSFQRTSDQPVKMILFLRRSNFFQDIIVTIVKAGQQSTLYRVLFKWS